MVACFNVLELSQSGVCQGAGGNLYLPVVKKGFFVERGFCLAVRVAELGHSSKQSLQLNASEQKQTEITEHEGKVMHLHRDVQQQVPQAHSSPLCSAFNCTVALPVPEGRTSSCKPLALVPVRLRVASLDLSCIQNNHIGVKKSSVCSLGS